MKGKYLKLFLLVYLLLAQSVWGQEWLLKITPFEMKFTDLDNILDTAPENYRNKELKYRLKEGNLFVYYSNEKCASTDWGKWNVSEGTIVGITFYPKKMRKPSFYKLNNSEMNKSLDNIGTEVFTSKEKGLLYTVYAGKVNEITFYPSKRFEKLRCAE